MLSACGGRAIYDGATPGSSAGAGGTNGVDGGIASRGTGASGGPIEMTQGDDGGMGLNPDATTSVKLGDFDHLPDEFPKTQLGSSFFWGGPNDIHLGNWFVASPGGASRDAPIGAVEPPRGDSTLACHVSGAEFAQGLDLFAELNHPNGSPISLSRYAGIAFWARTAAPEKLSVALNDGTGSLQKEGGWGGAFSASFATSPGWQRFEVPFADPERVAAVASIDFVIVNGGEGVDLWIDDLTLLCRGSCQ
jgi:hypothetical protein